MGTERPRGQQHPFGVIEFHGRQSVEHVESLGQTWAAMTEDYLVGAVAYLGERNRPEGQAAAAAEMQRRLLIAIREFNEQSKKQIDALITLQNKAGEQNTSMVWLTRWIVGLTVVLGVIAGLQLWAMLKGGA